MSVVGIITNCGLIGYTNMELRAYCARLGDTALALILFGLEHVVLFFKYWLHLSIPKIPASV